MFSGIIESKSKVLAISPRNDVFELLVERPKAFEDLKLGDSIANNGVCLTLEKMSSNELQFAVGAETLNITNWKSHLKIGDFMNLERSLRFGDRVHGHMVTGHVDAIGKVVGVERGSETIELEIKIPDEIRRFVWKKGGLAVNGVSLTVNSFEESVVQFLLIPETVKRTNLSDVKIGDFVNLEADYVARAIQACRETES